MTRLLTVYGVFLVVLLGQAGTVGASACQDFPWQYLSSDELPLLLREGRDLMNLGLEEEALEGFRQFIHEEPQGPFSEAARYAMATLPVENGDPSEMLVDTIDRLQAVRQAYPQSVYAPWTLCQIGDLYRHGGWFYEAKGVFEHFLNSYTDHPLTPGVLIGAGRNFLNNGQNLEGALVFRRVLDEAKWHKFHLEAALGLADGAAASKAWNQAKYWYDAVDLENVEVLHATPESLYLRGITELQIGEREKALNQFLTAFNLYPDHEAAGRSVNRLAEALAEQGLVVPSLWFAHQAMKRFPGQEPAYYGQAVLLRWVRSDLQKGPDAVLDSEVRRQLAELGIAVPMTWKEFRNDAARLVMVAGPKLAEEASYWIAKSYEIEGNPQEAMRRYINLVVARSTSNWGQQAAESAKELLLQHAEKQDWVELISFLDTYQDVFAALTPGPELKLIVAEAYRQLQLPSQACEWYGKVLAQQPPALIHEEALAKKLFVADQLHDTAAIKALGMEYERSYPEGRWIVDVASRLGALALKEQQFETAHQQYSLMLVQVKNEDERLQIQRHLLRIQRQAGHMQQAIQGYRTLIQEQRANADDQLVFADLLFDTDQIEEAASVYVMLLDHLETPDRHMWAQYRLAISYRRLGKIKESQALLASLSGKPTGKHGLGGVIRAVAAAHNSEFRLVSNEELTRATKK